MDPRDNACMTEMISYTIGGDIFWVLLTHFIKMFLSRVADGTVSFVCCEENRFQASHSVFDLTHIFCKMIYLIGSFGFLIFLRRRGTLPCEMKRYIPFAFALNRKRWVLVIWSKNRHGLHPWAK